VTDLSLLERGRTSAWPGVKSLQRTFDAWSRAIDGLGRVALRLQKQAMELPPAFRGIPPAYPRCSPASAAPLLAVVFIGAVALQGFHMLEHVAQVGQAFVLGLPAAHGLLGRVLDREWVHFVYNSSVWALMVMLFVGFRHRCAVFRVRRHLYAIFLGGLLVQSYHVVEHSVKLIQYLGTGVEPAPGILGTVLNLVWLHFWINLVVYVPILVAFFGYGFHAQVSNLFRPKPSASLQGLRGLYELPPE